MYLFFPGVRGNVRSGKYRGWFKVDSFQFGLGLGISSPGGGRRRRGQQKEEPKPEEKKDPKARPRREASAPSISEIVVTKTMDASSAQLAALTVMRHEYETVEIECVDKDGFVIYNIKLFMVMISGFSVSSGGGPASESISLNFTCFTLTTAARVHRPMKMIPKFAEKPEDKEAVKNMKIATLRDVLVRVFSYLEVPELYNASRACRLFYSASCDARLTLVDKHTVYYDLGNIEPTRLDGDIMELDEFYKKKSSEDSD